MDFAFEDKALRHVCESHARACKALGEDAAVALHARLADLEASDNILELNWLPVVIEEDMVSIEFFPTHRLIVGPNEAKPPKLSSGAVDWTKVSRVILKRIEAI
ncbi:hypothetical protein [Brevundimonas sp.]|uniref:hypothetical protein n=1 Tax=Brevundimonas sp. TaxID=1871086 RepID=UPI002C3CAB7E|nr:hypothetical protein [Brevundimonas sp.]HWQ85822.1 hypothetical protein [Brevundimonas sp.]